jgi:hypothetical protein
VWGGERCRAELDFVLVCLGVGSASCFANTHVFMMHLAEFNQVGAKHAHVLNLGGDAWPMLMEFFLMVVVFLNGGTRV